MSDITNTNTSESNSDTSTITVDYDWNIIPGNPFRLTPINEGWKCPGCGRIYAPHVDHCDCQKNNWRINYPYKITWGW